MSFGKFEWRFSVLGWGSLGIFGGLGIRQVGGFLFGS